LETIGITKFKSRSFEAWQKTGKHLFPVDPNTPLEEKPYMQRPGGSADGEDLAKKGLLSRARDQAAASAKSETDLKYEKMEREARAKASPFPWTSEAANNLSKANSKASKDNKDSKNAKGQVEEPPKKKLFGLF
jgi:hypothetical protein